MDTAAWHNEPAMVRMLLKAGADPNGEKNYPPLRSAAYRGSYRIVKLLLAQPKIKVDKRDIDGYTALIWAAAKGHAEMVDALLEAGADPSLKNRRGETAEDKARQRLDEIEGIIKRLGR